MQTRSMIPTKKNGKCRCTATKNPVKNTESTTPSEEQTVPLVDIIEEENQFLILADMPGVGEEDIDVNYSDGELTISGTFDETDEEGDLENVTFRCCQFDPGDYFRTFRVGESINAEGITADYANGVLTVRLPKREEVQPKKIAVRKKG